MVDEDDGLLKSLEDEEKKELFDKASEYMRTNRSLKLTTDQKLCLYGLFKQANVGPCNVSKPGLFDVQGRHKWDAWHKLGSMPSQVAMVAYLSLVTELDPNWLDSAAVGTVLGSSSGDEGGGKGGGGPVVSTLMKDEEVIPDEEKSVFDWCREGSVERLSAILDQTQINDKDDEGLSMLHWACDRGHLEVARLLLQNGADVNLTDTDSQTPLHYAASCGHSNVVSLLLSHPGINRDAQDCDGATPLQVSSDPSTTNLLLEQSGT